MAYSGFDRETAVYVAKLAEQTQRYDDMANTMKNLAKKVGVFTAEERNLLSVGYEKSLGCRRDSWKILSSKLLEEGSGVTNSNRIIEYRKTVETEMTAICRDAVTILDEHLIPSCKPHDDPVANIFYLKMKADFFRYVAEFWTGNPRKTASDGSFATYEAAMTLARAHLVPTHPIRLALALNFSIFYYHILGLPKRACEIAGQEFLEAYSEVDNLKDEAFRNSTTILLLIKDNFMQWYAEISGDESCHDGKVASI